MFAAVATGFLLGSVPWALVLGRMVHRVDIRTQGSGNLGATNAFRVLGPATGTAVLLLDAGKGFAAAYVAPGELLALAGGFGAVLGHVFSPWVRFRGGKGVATAAGAFGAVAPQATLAATAIWIVTVAATRWVSLGSIVAVAGLVAVLAATRGWSDPVTWTGCAAALLVIARHAGNVRRLAAGTEPRVSFRRGRGGGAACR